MLAWIIAAPNCNHWPRIERAIDHWRRKRQHQTLAEHRRNRHRHFRTLILDPAEGAFADQARAWANRRNLEVAAQGQPDVIFVCRRDLAKGQALDDLIRRHNPGRVVRIDGLGKITELPIRREPAELLEAAA